MEKKKYRKPLDLLLFFILGIGVGIAFGMSSVLILRQSKTEVKNYKYEIMTLDKCDNNLKLYYKDAGRNVYLYCINSIKIKEGNDTLDFKNYAQNHFYVLDELMNSMTVKDQYDDGGSTLYVDNKGLSKDGFSILKCETLAGNKDVYIGPKGMTYEKDFCKGELEQVQEPIE